LAYRDLDEEKLAAAGTGQGKIAAMKACGITVCEKLGTLGELCASVFGK
jgi:succinyl-CoA synthetase alpha subunit